MRTAYLQDGNAEALAGAREILAASQNLGAADRERLFGWLENKGKSILAECEAMLTEASKMPGLDGQKMSKSYGNTITMREDPATVTKSAGDADRSGPRAPHRSGARTNARYGSCTRCTATPIPANG